MILMNCFGGGGTVRINGVRRFKDRGEREAVSRKSLSAAVF